ncbi:P-type cation-transporting ATPase [Lachnellula subtilissima]|uniref:P-type cation-transporting ATPase n=1 Tax=Lachnellula subtilissima TaxID=602034 RepID=A0A8H8UE75_9HELO|nr:P-type cation-transporting ATPase [Lachnellula subtilissima]
MSRTNVVFGTPDAASGKDCSQWGSSFQSDKLDLPSLSLNNNDFDDQSTGTPFINEADLDHSMSNDVKHVILSVQGMDCISCEEKLRRAIISIPVISNIKSCGNISRLIHNRTGFTCTRIPQAGAVLNLIVAGDARRLIHDYPHGVIHVSTTKGKGNIVQVYNQPRIIGPRALLSNPFFLDTNLAPASHSQEVTSNRAQLNKTAYKTLISAFLTLPVLVLSYAPLPKHQLLFGASSLSLATFVQFTIVGSFYQHAFKTLFYFGMIEMDTLVVLSTSAAYIYSVIAFA